MATIGEGFPQYYAPIPLTAVVGVHTFPPSEDGSFEWPLGCREGGRVSLQPRLGCFLRVAGSVGLRALVQPVSRASVTSEGELVGSIGAGLCVLVGVTHDDDLAASKKVAAKIVGLRIFDDEEGVMNLSLADLGGQVLPCHRDDRDLTRKNHPKAPPKSRKPLLGGPFGWFFSGRATCAQPNDTLRTSSAFSRPMRRTSSSENPASDSVRKSVG